MKNKKARARLAVLIIMYALTLILTVAAQTAQENSTTQGSAAVPKIGGAITNNGPVEINTDVVFTGSCIGDNTQLILCRENAICNAQTDQQELLCASSFATTTEKSCTYTTTNFDEGTHNTDIATCCDDNGACDIATIAIDSWTVLPLTTEGGLVVDENNQEISAIVEEIDRTTEVIFTDQQVYKLAFERLEGAPIGVSSVSRGIIEPENVRFDKIFAIDLERVNFATATAFTTAVGTELYRCNFWDFQLGICLGSWEFLQRLTQEAAYSISLEKGSFGFAEGINTSLPDTKLPAPNEPLNETRRPKITETILNNGPVASGEIITFFAECRADVAKVVLCRDNTICNAQTSSTDLLCESSLTNGEGKQCDYTTSSLDIGTHTTTVATCCNDVGECDLSTALIDPWTVTDLDVNVTPRPQIIVEKTEEITQGVAEVNRPVKWTKRIRLAQKEKNITVRIHDNFSKVNVHKRTNNLREEISPKKIKLAKITTPTKTEQDVTIDELADDIEITYTTKSPSISEKTLTPYKKRVTISSSINYTNVLTTATIPETKVNTINLYWLINETRVDAEILNYNDTNKDGTIDQISWIVPHLSNQTYEIDITILNVQSYPSVGGTWEVRFLTTGTANLSITAIGGTTWDNVNEANDLKFLEIRCGEQVLPYQWIDNGGPGNSSAFVVDYSCNETGYETSKVLTPGKHHLEFDFGGVKAYAHNEALDDTVVGETGEFNLTGESIATVIVPFRKSYALPPVVLITPVTQSQPAAVDDSPLIVKVLELNQTEMNVTWCMDNGLTTCTFPAVSETFHFFAFDINATYPSSMEVGTISLPTDGSKPDLVFKHTFPNAPTLFLYANSYSQGTNNIAAHAWADEDLATTTSIPLIGCVHQGTADICTSSQPNEVFGYLAIDLPNHPFSGAMNFQHGSASITASAWTAMSFTDNYTNPRGMATQNDDNGAQDPQYAMIRDVYTSTPDFRYCEADGSDDCDNHNGESVYWFMMEDGFIRLKDTGSEPNVTLVTPADNNITVTGNINFTANATDNFLLKNATLYHNISGTFLPNQSINVTGTFNVSNFSLWDITTTVFIWNVQFCDNSSNCSFAPTNHTINVSIPPAANTPPVVEGISAIVAQTVTEDNNPGPTEISASFEVTDVDGTADIDDATANLTILRASGDGNSGVGNMSTNTTCFAEADIDSDTANYTCIVQVHYWFNAGEWNITAGIQSTTGESSSNTSNFTIQDTTALVISPLSMSFPAMSIGQENVTADDPMTINNTANHNTASGDVQMTAIDLVGEVTATDTIGANNFTMDVDTGGSPPAECDAATEMVNNTATGIVDSVLSAGNRSQGLAVELLYLCFNQVPSGISAQTYSTLNGTAWTLGVV